MQTFCCCLKNTSIAVFPLYDCEVAQVGLEFFNSQLFLDSSNSG